MVMGLNDPEHCELVVGEKLLWVTNRISQLSVQQILLVSFVSCRRFNKTAINVCLH